MTTNIQLLRSSIAYKRPSAAPLLEGQAAINYNAAEPGLYFRLTDGRLSKVGPTAVTDNGLAPNSAPAGEVGNSVGETWLNAQVSLYSPVGYVFDGNEFVTANGFKVELSSGDYTLMRTMNLQRLVANELQVDGPAVIGGNITPNGQNCAYFLGKATERWDYAFLCNLDVSKDGLIGNDLTVNRDTIVGRNLTVTSFVASNLIPDVGDTKYLGNSTNAWVATYTKDLHVNANTVLGSSCASLLTVNSTSTFKCEVIFEQPIDIDSIGKSCSDTLTINATTTVKCPITFEGTVTLPPTAIADPIFNGTISLGDGCNTSTINLNGAVTQSCDITPAAHNDVKIGTSAKQLSYLYAVNINGTSLTLSGKATSEPTVDGDAANTLVTKGWTQGKIDAIAGSQIWTRNGTEIYTATANDLVVPNGANATLGSAAKKWKGVYATDVYTGDLHLKNDKGDWTMIEAEEYLTIRNNKTGKTFKLMMEEV